jgi:signal transduction histidine kinase
MCEHEGVRGVELEVRDKGCGIRPEDLGHIFEPFFTTKPPGRGTGLGLAMTQRFLREYRGSINVESEPGRGTKVLMWLPAAPEEAVSRLEGGA